MHIPYKSQHKGSLLTVTSSGEFISTPEDKFKDLIATTLVLVSVCSCANGCPSVDEVVTVVVRGSTLTTGAVIAILYRSKPLLCHLIIWFPNKTNRAKLLLCSSITWFYKSDLAVGYGCAILTYHIWYNLTQSLSIVLLSNWQISRQYHSTPRSANHITRN
jgi:hypothetical protein